jgi:preprotein translocase subunit Sec61beta
MLASTLAGLIWFYDSPEITFIVSGTGVVIAIVYFMWMPYRRTLQML